jgi:hypothetical protein
VLAGCGWSADLWLPLWAGLMLPRTSQEIGVSYFAASLSISRGPSDVEVHGPGDRG